MGDDSAKMVVRSPTVDSSFLIPPGSIDAEPLPAEVIEAHLKAVAQLTREYEAKSKSERTTETYMWAWKRFYAWCIRRRLSPLPADASTVKLFIASAATEGIEPARSPLTTRRYPRQRPVGIRTLRIYLAAIANAHREHHLPAPNPDDWRKTIAGVTREHGKPPVKKGAFSEQQLEAAITALPTTLRGHRDRALLLVAYASGGRRRSEVVSMQFEQLQADQDGYRWLIPHTKTRSADQGFAVRIPRVWPGLTSPGSEPASLPSPAGALETWIAAASITSGPVFREVSRHGRVGTDELKAASVATVVKTAAVHAGLSPAMFSGHSLRASFVTNAYRAGRDLVWIRNRTGHRGEAVLLGYLRELGLA